MNEFNLEGRIAKPIFVFGCCNSGTTILWDSLKSHDELSGPDIEGQDLVDLPDSMRHNLGKATFRLWAHPKFKLSYYKTEEDYNEEERLELLRVYKDFHESGKRFITKSPADTLRARLIQAYFPDAYFVAIVRNGYAVSEGIIRKRKKDPDRPEFEGLYTTIDEAAEQWFRSNILVLSQEKFLNKYKIIRYEDLVDDPLDVLTSVLEFCELDDSGFSVPSFDNNRNQQQISRLSEYEKEVVTGIAQPMLIHFGYEILDKKLKWSSV